MTKNYDDDDDDTIQWLSIAFSMLFSKPSLQRRKRRNEVDSTNCCASSHQSQALVSPAFAQERSWTPLRQR
jgi:hypothetical protein